MHDGSGSMGMNTIPGRPPDISIAVEQEALDPQIQTTKDCEQALEVWRRLWRKEWRSMLAVKISCHRRCLFLYDYDQRLWVQSVQIISWNWNPSRFELEL